MELRGERVLLRSLRGDDRAPLAALIADPAIAEWWGEDEIAIDHGTDEEPVHQLAIELDGELIGYIQGYEQLDAQYRYAGIDLFLDPRWQGHGLGTEALRVLARWLIDDRGHHRLVIDPRADNARAIASYTKVGFRPAARRTGRFASPPFLGRHVIPWRVRAARGAAISVSDDLPSFQARDRRGLWFTP